MQREDHYLHVAAVQGLQHGHLIETQDIAGQGEAEAVDNPTSRLRRCPALVDGRFSP
jgi:hypothetical protein